MRRQSSLSAEAPWKVIVERFDGKRIAILINIDPLRDAQDKLIGVVSCFQDITERRPAYRDYILRTNAFFPGPPKKS